MTGKPPLGRGQISNKPYNTDRMCSLDYKLFDKIKEALQTRAYRLHNVIQFPEIFKVFSWYKIRKTERFDVIEKLKQEGFLRVIKGHGVELIEGRRP